MLESPSLSAFTIFSPSWLHFDFNHFGLTRKLWPPEMFLPCQVLFTPYVSWSKGLPFGLNKRFRVVQSQINLGSFLHPPMDIGEHQAGTTFLITGEVQIEAWLGLKWLSVVDQPLGMRFNGQLKLLFADVFERQNAVEAGFVFFEF